MHMQIQHSPRNVYITLVFEVAKPGQTWPDLRPPPDPLNNSMASLRGRIRSGSEDSRGSKHGHHNSSTASLDVTPHPRFTSKRVMDLVNQEDMTVVPGPRMRCCDTRCGLWCRALCCFPCFSYRRRQGQYRTRNTQSPQHRLHVMFGQPSESDPSKPFQIREPSMRGRHVEELVEKATAMSWFERVHARVNLWLYQTPLGNVVWVMFMSALVAGLTHIFRPSIVKYINLPEQNPPMSWIDSFVTDDTMQTFHMGLFIMFAAGLLMAYHRQTNAMAAFVHIGVLERSVGIPTTKLLRAVVTIQQNTFFLWDRVQECEMEINARFAKDGPRQSDPKFEHFLELQAQTHLFMAMLRDPLNNEVSTLLGVLFMFVGVIKGVHNFHVQGLAGIPVNIVFNVIYSGILYIITRLNRSYVPPPRVTIRTANRIAPRLGATPKPDSSMSMGSTQSNWSLGMPPSLDMDMTRRP